MNKMNKIEIWCLISLIATLATFIMVVLSKFNFLNITIFAAELYMCYLQSELLKQHNYLMKGKVNESSSIS